MFYIYLSFVFLKKLDTKSKTAYEQFIETRCPALLIIFGKNPSKFY